MKIEKLEVIAKSMDYIQRQEEQLWDDNDYINAAIHILLHDRLLWKAMHIILNMFPPVKLVYKSVLNTYIKKMAKLNNEEYELEDEQELA